MKEKINLNESIDALKEGSSSAIKQLYTDHYIKVKSMILKNNGKDEDAEDIFQEALVVFISNLKKKDFKLTSGVGTYLYAIAYNKWLYHLREVRKKPFMGAMPDEVTDIAEEIEEDSFEDRQKIAARLIGELGEECQKVLKLFYLENQKMALIAEKLNYTADFVKVKKHRCMSELKKKLSADTDYLRLISQ